MSAAGFHWIRVQLPTPLVTKAKAKKGRLSWDEFFSGLIVAALADRAPVTPSTTPKPTASVTPNVTDGTTDMDVEEVLSALHVLPEAPAK